MAATDLISVDFKTEDVDKLLKIAPRRFASAFSGGAAKAMRRYGGFHRARRMERKTVQERVSIFSTRSGAGLASNKWIKVKPLRGATLADAGAEARVTNIIFRQLEHGTTIRARKAGALLLPTREHRKPKGKASPKQKRLFQENRVRRMKTKNGMFLVHFPGYPRAKTKSGKRRKKGKAQLGKPLFLYILKRSVEIRPRLEFRQIFIAGFADTVRKNINYEIERTLERLNAGGASAAG